MIAVLLLILAIFYVFKNYVQPQMNPEYVANKEYVPGEREDVTEYIDVMMFTVDWCPYCKKAKPVWDEFKSTYDQKVVNGYKINIKTIEVKNYRDTSEKNNIEKKIFESRNIDFDIIENDNNYVVYKINKTEERPPNIDDASLKKEILELITQRNKFDYNRSLFKKINDKKFNDNDFKEMGNDKIETLTLTSINDNQKFETNTVELLYSLPTGSFTLVNDYLNVVYLAKIKSINNENISTNDEKFKEYIKKQNTNTKNNILKSYDFFLNEKYNVVLNQKTIERVKNFFQ